MQTRNLQAYSIYASRAGSPLFRFSMAEERAMLAHSLEHEHLPLGCPQCRYNEAESAAKRREFTATLPEVVRISVSRSEDGNRWKVVAWENKWNKCPVWIRFFDTMNEAITYSKEQQNKMEQERKKEIEDE
jgi:hypothetical protein